MKRVLATTLILIALTGYSQAGKKPVKTVTGIDNAIARAEQRSIIHMLAAKKGQKRNGSMAIFLM